MIDLYIHKNCNSVQRARQWLVEHQIHFKENKMTSLTREQIVEIMSRTERGVEEVLCVRSKLYKSMNLNVSNLTMNRLFEIIEKHPTLLKHPIIIGEKNLYVGFNEDEYRAFLPRKFRTIDLHKKRSAIPIIYSPK